MLIVNFAFSGTEWWCAAGETKIRLKMYQKRLMPRSGASLFSLWAIIVISALLPFQLAGLGGDGVSSSPFVTVFNYIGIPYADDMGL